MGKQFITESSKYRVNKHKYIMPRGKIGNNPIFENPDELYQLWLDYVDTCLDNEELPTVAGFRSDKCITKWAWDSYSKKEEFEDVYDVIADTIEHMTVNTRSVDGQTKKLILSTKFGYVDRTVSENKNLELNLVELVKSQMSPEMIEARAKELEEGEN